MKKVLLFITLSSAIFVGCNPKYYTPNTHNVPLISEKGETNLTLSGGDDRVEFQGAMVLPTDLPSKPTVDFLFLLILRMGMVVQENFLK